MPPSRRRMQARMRRGQHVLSDSDLPLRELALAAGFADRAHVTRVLRRFCGKTPAAWRRARRD